jgi:putative CRISPR-associated protein (TIGR02620 family)
MTDLERALDYIGNAHRKGSKSACWNEAEAAAEIAGVEVRPDETGRWPDLAALEKAIRAALDATPLIVTRHAALVEWLATQGFTGEVKAQVTADDVRGRRVIGVLPLHLAAEAAEVVAVDMPGLTLEQRRQINDLTCAEIAAAGAKLTAYVVTRK